MERCSPRLARSPCHRRLGGAHADRDQDCRPGGRGRVHVGHRQRHVLVPAHRADPHLAHSRQARRERPGRDRPRGASPGHLLVARGCGDAIRGADLASRAIRRRAEKRSRTRHTSGDVSHRFSQVGTGRARADEHQRPGHPGSRRFRTGQTPRCRRRKVRSLDQYSQPGPSGSHEGVAAQAATAP